MLIQNLAITYKCYSSIGNSLDLKEMMTEVLKTFVSETFAIYGGYYKQIENDELKKIAYFGKNEKLKLNRYKSDKNLEYFEDMDKNVIRINLEYGTIFIVLKNMDADFSFFISMFESFISKLNISVRSCLNIEKLKDTNEILLKQKEELEIANKSKDDFLANMSHELKTPLNSINVISAVMKKNKNKNLNEKEIKNLEVIHNCGKELLFLVNDVLDLSKLEAGKISLNYDHVDIHYLINRVYDSILPQANEKALDFTFHIDKTITYIYTDEKRVTQIIKNLLSNSLKFTKKGKINLRIKDEDRNIRIIVKDEGIGIKKDKLLHIFDRFKQADNSTTRKYGGTGLGLAISKELALLLKGDILVQSEVNKGSTFEIIIPKNEELINSYNYLELSTNDTPTDIKNKIIDKKDKKESILILNNNPIYFFKIIVELNKRYKTVQSFIFEDFLESNKNTDISKAVVDITTLTNKEHEMLIESQANNYILLFNKELDPRLEEKTLLNIEKKAIKNALTKI